MDYGKHYAALVERGRSRKLDGYTERHHVVPRCMGGGDEPANLVELTPEEHFVAHQLLVRINPGRRGLVFAAWAMTHGRDRGNKRYGWLKRQVSDAMKAQVMSDEARRKISEKAKGRKLAPEAARALHQARRDAGTPSNVREKLSAALLGKPKTEAHRAAMAAAQRARLAAPEQRAKLAYNRGRVLNDTQRAALLAATKGRPLSDAHRAKLMTPKGPQHLVNCPHCHKCGGQSLMKRWHFDNCGEVK